MVAFLERQTQVRRSSPIDAIRATDYEEDDGVIRGDTDRQESTCNQRPTENEASLVLASGHRVPAQLDERGRAGFGFSALPEEAVPVSAPSSHVAVGETRVPITISEEAWREVRSALLANPRSRLAIDVLARRRARCSQVADAARTAERERIDTAPDEVRSAWADAKVTCDDLWTPALDRELAEAHERTKVRVCGRRLQAVGRALDDVLSGEVLATLATELADIGAGCQSSGHVTLAKQLEAKIEGAAKKVAKAEADEARRIAREEAKQQREEQRREQKRRQRAQSWENARLLCNDGSLSPTCRCGRASYRGCCSHHGGVSSCSVEPQ